MFLKQKSKTSKILLVKKAIAVLCIHQQDLEVIIADEVKDDEYLK